MRGPGSAGAVLLLAALLLLGPASCSDDDAPAPAQDTGPPADHRVPVADQRADLPARLPDLGADARAPDTEAAAMICGQTINARREAVAARSAILCSEGECFNGSTDLNGKFCIAIYTAKPWVFHVLEEVHDGVSLSGVVFRLATTAADVAQRRRIDLGQVVLVQLGPHRTLDVQSGGTYKLGGGIVLKTAAGSTTLPLLASSADLAAAAVPTRDVHPWLLATGPAGKSPAASFTLSPPGVTFSSAKPARYEFPVSGLSPGTSLDLYGVPEDTSMFDEDTGTMKLLGQAVVDSTGTRIVPATGQGLTLTGWTFFYARP